MGKAEREVMVQRLSARIDELKEMPQPGGRERTELRLRTAMLRLINGEPVRTDGALTNENLSEEAAVPRATMYRYRDIMDAWKLLQSAVAPESAVGLQERIRGLKVEMRRMEGEHAEEKRKLLHVQEILVQRVQALTLSLVEARGGSSVVDIDLLRLTRKPQSKEAGAEESGTANGPVRPSRKS